MKVFNIVMLTVFQLVSVVVCFLLKDSTIQSLNQGGLGTLVSIIFLAPLFVLPLFLIYGVVISQTAMAIISGPKWLLILQVIMLAVAIYLSLDFFSKVQLN